ncbi:hypothetical protein Ddye_020652 [Dipteronia dyeriana]|uniref:Uncharacterized protein n=1 Tax=Dipteronia dyeriana TaxID=168575 RepID=A0AAD9U0C3_9ROSI|nr:hypothetical protein Ddye_020652 [Dipteronia dyeriana]
MLMGGGYSTKLEIDMHLQPDLGRTTYTDCGSDAGLERSTRVCVRVWQEERPASNSGSGAGDPLSPSTQVGPGTPCPLDVPCQAQSVLENRALYGTWARPWQAVPTGRAGPCWPVCQCTLHNGMARMECHQNL